MAFPISIDPHGLHTVASECKAIANTLQHSKQKLHSSAGPAALNHALSGSAISGFEAKYTKWVAMLGNLTTEIADSGTQLEIVAALADQQIAIIKSIT